MQVIRRVYPRGGHEWPPFLLAVILMLDPVLPGAEMTRQQLFMSVINRTKLTKTILNIAGRDVERSGFRQELHA
ncbi:hypothetical protein [Sulfuricaulis sp.]|jgi:hypothetical protein|uniref:hypothetical protein n=1 Tax=Sulfuricaulis sp. TaxID=2003553 RepID=UPI00355AB217